MSADLGVDSVRSLRHFLPGSPCTPKGMSNLSDNDSCAMDVQQFQDSCFSEMGDFAFDDIARDTALNTGIANLENTFAVQSFDTGESKLAFDPMDDINLDVGPFDFIGPPTFPHPGQEAALCPPSASAPVNQLLSVFELGAKPKAFKSSPDEIFPLVENAPRTTASTFTSRDVDAQLPHTQSNSLPSQAEIFTEDFPSFSSSLPCTPVDGNIVPSDPRAIAADVRPFFDVPMSYWQEVSALPAIAQALEPFLTEKQTRKSGRLDIVQWVAYMSAFGVEGPSDTNWNNLIYACCFTEDPQCPGKPLRLPVRDIAALLAFTKVNDNLPENVSYSIIVKSRLKPAVCGRTDARCPGILPLVQKKFDCFVFKNIGLGFYRRTMDEICPSTILSHFGMPTVGVLSASSPVSSSHTDCSSDTTTGAGGHAQNLNGLQAPFRGITNSVVHELAATYAIEHTKKWEQLMREWLQLHPSGPRTQTFKAKHEEIRRRFKESIYNKLSSHLFDLWCPGSARLPPGPNRSQYYRRCPSFSSASSSRSLTIKGEMVTAATDSGTNDGICEFFAKNEKAIHYPLSHSLDITRYARMSANTVLARVTVLELHAPGAYGTAALHFLPRQSEELAKQVSVKPLSNKRNGVPAISHDGKSSHRTAFRLADMSSPPFLFYVQGAEKSSQCRGLQLVVELNVLPVDSRTKKRQFRYTKIKSFEWVRLGPFGRCDKCCEADAVSELNDDDPDELFENHVPDWLQGSAVNAFASGVALEWTVEDTCDRSFSFPVQIRVPVSVLSRVDRKQSVASRSRDHEHHRVHTNCESETDSDSDEEHDEKGRDEVFDEEIRIDCCTDARFEYTKSASVEIAYSEPAREGLFNRLPVWKWRQI